MKYLIAILLCFTLIGCHKDNSDGPGDTTAVYDPAAMDDDDISLNAPQAAGGCFTITSTRMNSGRRMWKINKPLWKYARYGTVRFGSGYTMRVTWAKANRTKAGAVVRPGSTTKNIIAIWAPYSDKSTRVTACLQ